MPVREKFDGGGEKLYFQAQVYLRRLFRTLSSGQFSCKAGFTAQGGLGSLQPGNNGRSGGMTQLGREAHRGVCGGLPGLVLPACIKVQQLMGTPGTPRACTAALVRRRGE